MQYTSNNSLNGKTLEHIVTHLMDRYGWDELARRIPIEPFQQEPSIRPAVAFLRKTSWARKKVEDLYFESIS